MRRRIMVFARAESSACWCAVRECAGTWSELARYLGSENCTTWLVQAAYEPCVCGPFQQREPHWPKRAKRRVETCGLARREVDPGSVEKHESYITAVESEE